MPRAGRNKGHKGRRGGTKKTVRRPPKDAPRRGPALHERDGSAAAAVLKQVGERLSTRPGVVRRVLQCFDYCELAHAVCVSRCWRATAEALMPRRLADFWADPDRSKLEEVLAKLDMYEKFVEDSQKDPPGGRKTPDGKPIRTAFPDPLLGRLALCWENGLGAHVLNDGATCRVGYVSLAERLRGKNIKDGMLIVAQDEELDKWRAAFSGKNYFRGGLDQDKNWTTDEEFRVYACSEKCVIRHGACRNPKLWSLLVVDIGGRSARTMSRRLLSIQALSSHLVVSSSVPRQGLDLAEARCRFEFVFKSSPDVYGWYTDNLSQSLGSGATPAERCLGELARRDLSKRLTSGPFAVNVAAVAGARPKILSPLPCVVCGRHGVGGEKLRVCGACGARAYCSKGCQRIDWLVGGGGHRKTCLRTRSKRSRRICHVCGKRGDLAKEAFSLCMGCDRRYCSVECSDVDWASGHATECPGAGATPAAETYGPSAAGS